MKKANLIYLALIAAIALASVALLIWQGRQTVKDPTRIAIPEQGQSAVSPKQYADTIAKLSFSYNPRYDLTASYRDYAGSSTKQIFQSGQAVDLTLSDKNKRPIIMISAFSDDFTDWLTASTSLESETAYCSSSANDSLIGCQAQAIKGKKILQVSRYFVMEGSPIFENYLILRNESEPVYKNIMIRMFLQDYTQKLFSGYDETEGNKALGLQATEDGRKLLQGRTDMLTANDQLIFQQAKEILDSLNFNQ